MGWVISIFLNVVLGVINFIFTLVIEYIDVCDCLLVGFIVWLFCYGGFKIHSGIAFLIALAVVIPLYILFKNRIGFWIVSISFSFLWSYVFMEWVVKGIFEKSPDTIWSWIIYTGAFLFNIATHQYASHRFDNLMEDETTVNHVHVEEYPQSGSDNRNLNFDARNNTYDPVAEYEAARKRNRWK